MRHICSPIAIALGYVLTGSSISTPSDISSVTREIVFERDFRDKPTPSWHNGQLVALEKDRNPPEVLVFGLDGRLARKHVVEIPDAAWVNLRTATVAPSGRVAVAGTAVTSDGRGAQFIAWISASGGMERIVRTSPYSADCLCFAPDETLWAAGQVLNPDKSSDLAGDVLRRYRADGRLALSMLPEATFSITDRLLHYTSERCFLSTNSELVAFYSETANEYVEVSLSSDAVLNRLSGVPMPRETRISGVVLTAGGDVYVSTNASIAGERRPKPTMYRFERSNGVWSVMDISALRSRTGGPVRVLGALGDDLLIIGKMPTVFGVRPGNQLLK